jgi:hypothetical protein
MFSLPAIRLPLLGLLALALEQVQCALVPHDPAGEGIDHERRVHESRPSRNVGQVGHPQLVRTRHRGLTLHEIRWSGRAGIALRRLELSAPNRALEPPEIPGRFTLLFKNFIQQTSLNPIPVDFREEPRFAWITE